MTRGFTHQQALCFFTYFNVADEIWPRRNGPGLTLADIEAVAITEARAAAAQLDLPWPPDLAVAEEYALDHGPALRFAADLTNTNRKDTP